MRTKILLVVLSLQLAGCSTVATQLSQDRRDAPWDPKGSASLMDQIPNWDGGANQVCCGHLRTCKVGQSPRC
jgi:uncharacterized protein YceK